jgi:GxxExxY protein
MHENEISREVVDAAYKIHKSLGPGLLESAYEALMVHELRRRGFDVVAQKPMPLRYDGMTLDVGYRADIVVEDRVIVELKSTDRMLPVYAKQLLTYLRVSDKRLGLLINFGLPRIKDGIKRVVNGLDDR